MTDPLDDLIAARVPGEGRIPPRVGPLARAQLRLFANVIESFLEIEARAAVPVPPTIAEILEETVAELRRLHRDQVVRDERAAGRGWDPSQPIDDTPTPYFLDEGDRQAAALAIAELSLRRPGWTWMLGQLADRLASRDAFEEFRRTSADNGGPRR